MSILTCERCIYAKPGIVDAPAQIVNQTDYRAHLIIGPVCGYKDGKTCVIDDTRTKEEANKLYVHVYQFMATARAEMEYYIREYQSEIKHKDYLNLQLSLSNGDVHIFMNESSYCRWCKGRTDILNGKQYRSGVELKEVSE